MILNDVERLIREEKIIACNLEELQVITIKKALLSDKYGIYANYVKLDNGLKEKVTFLYKVDDTHYVEYYSKKTILVINKSYREAKLGETRNFKSIINDYKTKYKDCPIILFKNSTTKIDAKVKNIFSKNGNYSSPLIKLFEDAKEQLCRQYEEAVLDNKKETYANKVFRELKGKKAFIVRISALQNVRIKQNNDSNGFKYYFERENRTIFTTLETTNFTILTEITPTLYEDYYTKSKMMFIPPISEEEKDNAKEEAHNESMNNLIIAPENFNDFCSKYNSFFTSPLVGAREFQEYNSSTMHLIGNNFDKEEEIRKILTIIECEAKRKLEEDNRKIEKKDENDAYVDNVLVDMALSLRNKNTD